MYFSDEDEVTQMAHIASLEDWTKEEWENWLKYWHECEEKRKRWAWKAFGGIILGSIVVTFLIFIPIFIKLGIF